MLATRFATYVFKLVDGFVNHCKTICESDQQITLMALFSLSLNRGIMVFSKFTNKFAAHSSNLGIVVALSGATFDFDAMISVR